MAAQPAEREAQSADHEPTLEAFLEAQSADQGASFKGWDQEGPTLVPVKLPLAVEHRPAVKEAVKLPAAVKLSLSAEHRLAIMAANFPLAAAKFPLAAAS
ncbi:MAG: hypothetical protein WCF58_05590 [Syntrophobacteraceae bacterium]